MSAAKARRARRSANGVYRLRFVTSAGERWWPAASDFGGARDVRLHHEHLRIDLDY